MSGGIGGGIGAGVSMGGGVSAGGGFNVGAALTATAGAAFADLHVAPPSLSVDVFDARAALLPAPRVAGSASFNPGGRAVAQAGGSLSADVGAHADLHGRIRFGS
ncbi:hypothetical protein [Roseateles chitinivorans]|uniref:hypothetical protein n=1 Tax=Roseateles chitinivorans TaxID=2917965 RepID=UPI003D66FE73